MSADAHPALHARRAWVATLLAAGARPTRVFAEGAGDAATLAGIWRGEIVWRGDRTVVFVEIAPGRTVPWIARLSLPAIHLYDLTLGPAAFDGRTLRFDTFSFAYDAGIQRLTGTLPADLVPVYTLKTELVRTARLERAPRSVPAAPARAPVWVADLDGPVWSDTVAAPGGLVLVGTDTGHLHALDVQDGSPRWRYRADGALRSAPVVAGSRVFLTSDDGVLHAVDLHDRRAAWQVRVNRAPAVRLPPSEPGSKYDLHGAPVVVAGDRVFACTHEGRVLALDAATGAARWNVPTSDRMIAAPHVAAGTVYAGGYDGKVHAIDAASGAVRWTFDAGAPVTATPTRVGAVVVASSRAYDLWGLDARTGRPRWVHYRWFTWTESSPAVAGLRAYVGSSDGAHVLAFDAATGRIAWRTDVHGLAWGRPALAGDRVVIGTRGVPGPVGHRGYVLALDRASGAVRWLHALAPADTAAPHGVAGAVAVAGHRAVAATIDGRVLAFDLG